MQRETIVLIASPKKNSTANTYEVYEDHLRIRFPEIYKIYFLNDFLILEILWSFSHSTDI